MCILLKINNYFIYIYKYVGNILVLERTKKTREGKKLFGNHKQRYEAEIKALQKEKNSLILSVEDLNSETLRLRNNLKDYDKLTIKCNELESSYNRAQQDILAFHSQEDCLRIVKNNLEVFPSFQLM